jgi:hypothetical protein
MFNLEREVTKWRMGLEAGLLSAETIDELESHLRDEFDSQLKSGFGLSRSFQNAVHRLGDISELRAEFGKDGNALPPGRNRLFKRLTVGFVHSKEVKVLACTGIVFGLIGFFVFIYGFHRTLQAMRTVGHPLLRLCVAYLAMSLTCLLGVVTSYRYWRLRRTVEARSVISFNMFVAFFFVWWYVTYLNGFRYDSPSVILYFSGVASLVFVLWLLYMRRLARLSSAGPAVRQVHQ